MPLAGINRVVIDLMRRAEGLPTVGAARKHHVGCASARRHHTCQHINVVVCRASGTINRQEGLSCESARIYIPTKDQAAAEINWGNPVKSWRLPAKLRIAGAHTIEVVGPFATDKEVAIGVHIERSEVSPVRNNDRSLPGDPAVGGPLELHAVAATVSAVV